MSNESRDENSCVSVDSDETNTEGVVHSCIPGSEALRPCNSVTSLPTVCSANKYELCKKNYLIGSTAGGAGAMLGSRELNRIFPSKSVWVHAVTWNMSNPKQQQYPDDLSELFFSSPSNEVASIYLVCLQEIPNEKQELLIRLQASIGPRHVLFSYAIHGSLAVLVFLARELIWYTSVPQSTGVTTRAAVKTKGAAGICFMLFGTSMLFLSCHFKAHTKNLHLRVRDYEQVVANLNLPRVGLTKGYRQKGRESLDRFDVIFWAGDMNFRIQHPRHIVENLLTTERTNSTYDNLLTADELLISQAEGRVFPRFHEGRITFPPTYKFDLNSDTYDSSEKRRTPSYTDRILFMSQKKGTVVCLHYDMIPAIRTSDHRAVYGFYSLKLKAGCDNVALAAGSFHRDIYIAGNQRRARRFDPICLPKSSSKTRVCSLQ
ncbi:Phosphatidylinositol-bisphosphatase [Paragonimus heterotremus]|uniref:Phosphatidylinositol-bisphosphatase n=1 Tax=Paragonimus heterotremus TaxID=100268 RepID=A0A8J4WGT7_9TREM|nr:Phosphatidylinositol-bisphosphatase [Paragonimus heterotremus]